VINALYRLGAEVLYEDNAFVHVSGHASQEDLKQMFDLTRPRYFIPVHGEYRHLLGHARLAESVGIGPDRVFLIEDGVGVEFSTTTARRVDGFPAGRVLVNGKSVGEIGPVVLRDRQLLAEDGLVAVSVAVDRRGALLAGPEIASRGFVYVKENEPLLEEMKKAVLAALAERDPDVPFDASWSARRYARGPPVRQSALSPQAGRAADHSGALMATVVSTDSKPRRRRKRGSDRWLGEVKGIVALLAAGFALVALATFEPTLTPASSRTRPGRSASGSAGRPSSRSATPASSCRSCSAPGARRRFCARSSCADGSRSPGWPRSS